MSGIISIIQKTNEKFYHQNISSIIDFHQKIYKKCDISKDDLDYNQLAYMFLSSNQKNSHSEIENIAEDENIIVLSIGSIYVNNYQSIKKNKSLSEVILKGYRSYGLDIIKSLNGSFGLIIIDKLKKQIIASRDRLGTQLLFCAKGKWGMAFASEIKSILCINEVKNLPNWDTIFTYLFKNYRYAFGSKYTFFKEIELIEPNTINIFDFNGFPLRTINITSWKHIEPIQISTKAAADKFLSLMGNSYLKSQTELKTEPAFLLSGGLDSPTVAAIAALNSNSPIKSYSICFGDEEIPGGELSYDERFLIKKIVDKHQMNWIPIYVKPDNFEEIYDEMSIYHDEPIASPTWYSHWLLMQKINQDGHNIVYGGDGGDHALAGLYDDIPYFFADLKFKNKKEELDREIKCWEELHDHPIYRKNLSIWNKYAEICFDWTSQGKILNYTWDEGLFRKTFDYSKFSNSKNEMILDKENQFPSMFKSYLISKLHQDLVYTSSPPSTRAEYINCKKFEIDLKSIFLENEVLNFCWSLPSNMMIRNGYTKYLIRESMTKILPDEVLWKKDHIGLNSPANIWFRGKLKGLMEETISWDGWEDLNIIQKSNLNKLWNQHLEKTNDHMMFL